MNDSKTTLQELKNLAIKLADDRDWGQFHSPKNLAIDISVEASELMEIFIWCTTQDSGAVADKNRSEVEQELADVLIAAFLFANKTNIDIAQAVKKKLQLIEQRYPVHLAKGSSTKYTKLHESDLESK